MALLKTVTLDNGLTITNAYHKIVNIKGNKSNLILDVIPYVSKDYADKNKPAGDIKSYYMVPSIADDSTNFIKQGYAYLKTLDEFKTATDC